ncbi:CheR family methyltransferase [Polyangium jinanense]|uniref:Methyltransferase domain-containing protein n=1 Tax=Polyangium jinanense TaxID=2829994 RepID=A0A9X4ARX4_9BACT|nr:CheR family methyltransferase [Polyangium jinanense]MDC3952999.1 methyltransferase domain-containing protein [Polyangium jinanense]MDC3980617.1 methyltransferase domain-containing protein [Polyangium jinanense]
MNAPRDAKGIEDLIEARFGLAPSAFQRDRIETILDEKPIKSGGPIPLERLVEAVTVGETYFFREPMQIDALVRRVLPERALVGPRGRKLRILSAGCSSGEEPYTMAIAAEVTTPELSPLLSITGLDLNGAAIEKARRARYSPWAVRGASQKIREQFFRKDGETFVLDPRIQSRVTFEEGNLLDVLARVPEATYDVVFCRNVLIYFSERALHRALAGFGRALLPGGYLFLGHSESLRGISDGFELVHEHDAFYYRLKSPSAPTITTTPAFLPLPLPEPPMRALLPTPEDGTFAWAEEIQRSADRIARIAETREAGDAASVGQARAAEAPSALARVLDLLEAERHDEALLLVSTAGPGAPPELELCRAAIYGEKGRLRDAERTLGALLARGQCETGAHYLLGLLRENERDIERAAWHYREAKRRDPLFSLPRLRLGMVLRREGYGAQACVELEKALDLLQREERARIVMFGGGFRREVLLELCKAQLGALGVPKRDPTPV